MSDGQLRRQPKRASGRAIVEAIVQAARVVVDSDGYENLTTKRIAEVAGVSIGSVYQYFPDREAVVAELARTLERRTLELATKTLDEAQTPDEAIDSILEVLASTVLGNIRTRAELLRHIPRSWIHDASAEVDDAVLDMVEGGLRRLPHALPAGDPKIMAFVLVNSVEGVVEACVQHHPEWIENGALHAHLRDLVHRFLGLHPVKHGEAPTF